MRLSCCVLHRPRFPSARRALAACAGLFLCVAFFPARAAAQDGRQIDDDRAAEIARSAELARADSVRAALAGRRPPNDHPTDLADVVAIPFRVVGAPFRLVLVELPAWAIGELTLPRPPGVIVRVLGDLRQAGVHPGLSTSIGPRSGLAATLRFDALEPLELETAFSTLGSQRHRLRAAIEPARLRVGAEARWQRDAQVGFYGIGPDTPDDRALYRRETFDLGLGGDFRHAPLRLHAELGYEDNLIREPIDGDEPSLDEAFDPADLFGATGRQRYLRLGGGAELDLTRRRGFQDRGIRLLARATSYDGVNATTSEFRKIRLEAQGLAPLNPRQILALRGRTELTRGMAGEVPFYHLAELGGEESAIGYPDTRFRDDDMVSLTAEWRYEIWRDIHNSMRVESFLHFGEGAVGRRLGEIAPEDWRASYGFGFRVARSESLLGLVFLGFSEESVRFGVSGEWAP
jgi:hypothetical protein